MLLAGVVAVGAASIMVEIVAAILTDRRSLFGVGGESDELGGGSGSGGNGVGHGRVCAQLLILVNIFLHQNASFF